VSRCVEGSETYAGLSVSMTSDGMNIDTDEYVEKCVDEFELHDLRPRMYASDFSVEKAESESANVDLIKEYQSLLGAVSWSVKTRPRSSFSYSWLHV